MRTERGVARVLFVDDEPLVIRSLRRTLAGRSLPWEIHFSDSGQSALQLLRQEQFDVIVTDLQMPGMSGAAVLLRVQDEHPDVARVVLSGLADPAVIARMAPSAHLVLTKPFEVQALVAAIDDALELRKLLARRSGSDAARGPLDLEKAPPVYRAVTLALAEDEGSRHDLMVILDADAEVSLRLGRLASHAPGDPDRPRPRLSSYVARAEPNALRALVFLAELSLMVDRALATRGAALPLSLEAFERHAMDTAHLATRIVGQRDDEEDAFVAGLLHDVGELLLAVEQPEAFTAARKRNRESLVPIEEAERAALGVSHAEAGARLLGLVGFPRRTIDAVLAHHDASPRARGAERSRGGLAVSEAVYAASILAHDPEAPVERGSSRALDPDRLGRRVSRVDEWRLAARKLRAGVGG